MKLRVYTKSHNNANHIGALFGGKVPAVIIDFSKMDPEYYGGKFHGYCTTRGELRRLYKKAFLNLIVATSVNPYRYAAILKAN